MVFPLYDDNPLGRARLPLVTWGLMAINIVVFLLMMANDEARQLAIIRGYGAVPEALVHSIVNRDPWPAVSIVTSMFVHAGWVHIVGNMVYLWVFGDDIEDALGPLPFLAFYLLSGIAAVLIFVAFTPPTSVPLVGASGAISGVLAAYMMLRPCAKVAVFVLRTIVRVPAWLVIGAWAAFQLFSFVSVSGDGVAYVAHLGGLIAGALFFWGLRPAGVKLFQCSSAIPAADGTRRGNSVE
ncbi:MAG: rhomboid family intramembrane serine protease [Proteobacteria bacterium]|nr:rhomboid family intramembrane serine protease [Pseudomonadota bacterium]